MAPTDFSAAPRAGATFEEAWKAHVEARKADPSSASIRDADETFEECRRDKVVDV